MTSSAFSATCRPSSPAPHDALDSNEKVWRFLGVAFSSSKRRSRFVAELFDAMLQEIKQEPYCFVAFDPLFVEFLGLPGNFDDFLGLLLGLFDDSLVSLSGFGGTTARWSSVAVPRGPVGGTCRVDRLGGTCRVAASAPAAWAASVAPPPAAWAASVAPPPRALATWGAPRWHLPRGTISVSTCRVGHLGGTCRVDHLGGTCRVDQLAPAAWTASVAPAAWAASVAPAVDRFGGTCAWPLRWHLPRAASVAPAAWHLLPRGPPWHLRVDRFGGTCRVDLAAFRWHLPRGPLRTCAWTGWHLRVAASVHLPRGPPRWHLPRGRFGGTCRVGGGTCRVGSGTCRVAPAAWPLRWHLPRGRFGGTCRVDRLGAPAAWASVAPAAWAAVAPAAFGGTCRVFGGTCRVGRLGGTCRVGRLGGTCAWSVAPAAWPRAPAAWAGWHLRVGRLGGTCRVGSVAPAAWPLRWHLFGHLPRWHLPRGRFGAPAPSVAPAAFRWHLPRGRLGGTCRVGRLGGTCRRGPLRWHLPRGPLRWHLPRGRGGTTARVDRSGSTHGVALGHAVAVG
ncbi:hypothetical protein C7M84_001474 [Penaeus vannamei]|uniref:Uncharacterized protein n=1 Tax=Penaeus vannamei TaxID=6689 RepID=A0A3R7PX08_PENVA|nr:hypothetical protein C7M84_001474 [Penaeus vannamei]